MESISIAERAEEIRDRCLAGEPVSDELLLPLVETASGEGVEAVAASRALFTGVVEPLADRFEPALCEVYADLFARALAHCCPDYDASELAARYRRVRAVRHFSEAESHPRCVYVLSRVTLGSDVVVTSTVLDALKKRFPGADIKLVGPAKNAELFAADTGVEHVAAPYNRRGTLPERLSAGRALADLVAGPDCLVVDPDSRLTQLGLVPVCPEENYYFFESRAFGGDGMDSLTQLTKRWLATVFGVVDARPYIAPSEKAGAGEGAIAVSFGTGENPAKGMGADFEAGVLSVLLRTGAPVMVDRGAGGEEAERVNRAIAAAGAPAGAIRTWDGSFAGFAAHIRASRLYVGYDSAGQHVAAAARTPLVSVFAGAISERFFARWRPVGLGRIETLRCDPSDTRGAIRSVTAATKRLLGRD